MDELKRLVKLVTEGSIRPLPLVIPQEEVGLESKLIDLIQRREVDSDEEAAAALYDTPFVSSNYRMLKSRLRRKLLNNLFFIAPTAKNNGLCKQEAFECNALLHQAQNLIYAGESKIADKLLEQVLAIAKPAELNSIIVQVLELRLDLYLQWHRKKLFRICSEELTTYLRLESKEREAALLFKKTKLELDAGVSAISKSLPFMPEVLQRLYLLWQETGSPRVYNFYHVLRIGFLEYTGDYEGIASVIQKAEELVQQGKLNSRWFNRPFNTFIMAYAMLRTHQLEKGLQLVKNNLEMFETSVNWYGIMDTYVLLAFYSRDYTLVLELIKKVASRTGTLKATPRQLERWELNRRYLLLVAKQMPEEFQRQCRKIESFSSITHLPKDKEGFNLPLLILEFFQGLDNNHVDELEKHAERLRKYTLKYLRGERFERGRLFLRLLLLVTKESLSYNAVRTKSQSLFEKLKQAPPPRDASAEVEIVPYEHLWEVAIYVIQQRANKR